MNYLDPPPGPAPVEVYKDVGGVVRHYQAVTAMYRAERREVRLHECRSACTMALSLPNVCVYPDSVLKFHQAYNRNTMEVDEEISDQLWRSYPPAVRARLGELTREYQILDGAELISLGVRNCLRQPRQNAPEIVMAKARRQPAPEKSSDFFGGVRTALAPLIGDEAVEEERIPMREIRVARAVPVAPQPFIAPLPPIPQRDDQTASVRQSQAGVAVASLQTPTSDFPASLGTAIETPLPPHRPVMYAAAPPPSKRLPPMFYIRQSPQLKAISGSFPVLEAQFVPLSTLRRKFASAGL